jgi:hypothetical protein
MKEHIFPLVSSVVLITTKCVLWIDKYYICLNAAFHVVYGRCVVAGLPLLARITQF